MLYGTWSAFLLTVLPDRSGAHNALIPVATVVAACVAAGFALLGLLGFLRIGSAEGIPLPRRRLAAVKLFSAVLPALLVSVAVPLLIRREPALAIAVVSPERAEEIVAPLSVVFSAREAAGILRDRNLIVEKFVWDFDGDGKMNAETADPQVTAWYDRQGAYAVSLTMFLRGGGVRRVTRRFAIDRAVFSVDPGSPVVDEPARLSIAHLFAKESELDQAEWDFDDNGQADLVTRKPDVTHTFYGEGKTTISVKVTLASKEVRTYRRTVDVLRSLPLPFPVTFTSEPEHLVGPPPLGALFRVVTEEPLRVVLWSFGDGAEAKGERVGHTFTAEGVYPVKAELRSQQGVSATITKVVRVTPELKIADLSITGTPDVMGDKITGEVPVHISLKPRTTLPLIDFFWEAPEASSVGSTKETVQASYRKEGLYTLWLVGQDPDGRVLRKPFTIEVLPASSQVSMLMDPESGAAPLTVRFDASETIIRGEQISGFEWTFGDERQGGAQQQGAQVAHTFRSAGTYEITVSVFTTVGKEYTARKTIVVRAPVLSACIRASRTEGSVPLGIQFNSDCSKTGGSATTYLWDFGDGFTSDQVNPIHDFQEPGVYRVTLTLRDGDGTSTSDPLTITVQ